MLFFNISTPIYLPFIPSLDKVAFAPSHLTLIPQMITPIGREAPKFRAMLYKFNASNYTRGGIITL